MYYVYITTNRGDRVLYVGVTNDLHRRMQEHSSAYRGGFTERYKVHKLIYFEAFQNVKNAIAREKQLKGWSRMKKIELIRQLNPDWTDLAEELAGNPGTM